MNQYLLKEHLPYRMMAALMGGVLFAIVGSMIPNVYYQYFDPTEYYTIEQPVPTDKKEYALCEDTVLLVQRTSLIDSQASSIAGLVLIRVDGAEERIVEGRINRDNIVIRKGTVNAVVRFPLPCELPEGIYYWQVAVKYSVRGIDKQYSFISSHFHVDPEAKK